MIYYKLQQVISYIHTNTKVNTDNDIILILCYYNFILLGTRYTPGVYINVDVTWVRQNGEREFTFVVSMAGDDNHIVSFTIGNCDIDECLLKEYDIEALDKAIGQYKRSGSEKFSWFCNYLFHYKSSRKKHRIKLKDMLFWALPDKRKYESAYVRLEKCIAYNTKKTAELTAEN